MHSMLEISPAWIQQITIHGSAHVHVSAEAFPPLIVGRALTIIVNFGIFLEWNSCGMHPCK